MESLAGVCPMCGTVLSEPYIKCAECDNPKISICLDCFAKGREYGQHQNDHAYTIMKNDFSLFHPKWTAADEVKLLDAIRDYGVGNWSEIALVVGSKSKSECLNHFLHYYVYNPKPPLPKFSEPEIENDSSLTPIVYTSAKDPPRPVVGSATYGEIAGYMPARGDFVFEHDDFLEMTLSAETDSEGEDDEALKKLRRASLQIFRNNVKKRTLRKAILKRYALISTQKNFEEWRRYQGLGKNVLDNLKPLMRLMNPDSFDTLLEGQLCEIKLKQRIGILQECRRAGIAKLQGVNTYLKLKQKQEQRLKSRTMLDDVLTHVKDDASRNNFLRKQVLRDTSQGLPDNIFQGGRRAAPPLAVIGLPGFEHLTEKERDLCSMLRIYPSSYLQYKSTLVNEYRKLGYLRLANARSVMKIDVNKTRKIYDLLLDQGVVTKDFQGIV